MLRVDGNAIGDEWMEVISDALQHSKSLIQLCVTKCGLSVKGTYYSTIFGRWKSGKNNNVYMTCQTQTFLPKLICQAKLYNSKLKCISLEIMQIHSNCS